jgi:hypothetical protein
MYQADGYKMDYGGHDTVITGNLFWKEGGDGQDCINVGGFLHKHGTVWRRNKCMLPKAHGIGHVHSCDCPGRYKPNASDVECGVDIGDNEYYGFMANLTINCGGKEPTSFTDWQGLGNDKVGGSASFASVELYTLLP